MSIIGRNTPLKTETITGSQTKIAEKEDYIEPKDQYISGSTQETLDPLLYPSLYYKNKKRPNEDYTMLSWTPDFY